MSQREPVACGAAVEHERVHRDGLQIARDEPVHFKRLVESWYRNDVDLIAEFDDLLDGNRDNSGRMICLEKVLGSATEVLVGQKRWMESALARLGPPNHLDQLIELLLGDLLAPERPEEKRQACHDIPLTENLWW